MINNDLEFLQWLAKRLVNRYNEDPKLILIVDDIIHRISSEVSIYREINNIINTNVISSIKNLKEVVDYVDTHSNKVNEKAKEKIIERNNISFENIDLIRIMKRST